MSKKLAHSTALVASMTLISRVFGFARDLIWAQTFGSVVDFDAFVVAFKVPNFMRSLFAEGAFSQAFIPVLAEYHETKTPGNEKSFINAVAGDLFLILSVVTLLGVILAPLWVMIFSPGFLHDPHRFAITTSMLRVSFPYLLLISLTAFCGAILNTHNYFAVPAFTPVLLNITLIAATLLVVPHFSGSLMVLPWALCVAGLLQLLLQLPFLRRIDRLPVCRINFKEPGVRRVFKIMLGALFGLSINQISLFIDTLFASFLTVGSISWIYYAGRLMNFPLGVIGVAIATVVMPKLAKEHVSAANDKFLKILRWGLQLTLLLGVPAAVGLFVLARPLLTTLFGYGKFNAFDIMMTANGLKAFACGVPAFMMIRVLNAALYARQNIRAVVKASLMTLIINIVLNIILMRPFAHVGLIIATSLSSWLGVALLLFYLKQSLGKTQRIFKKESLHFMFKMLFAAVAIIVWLLWAGSYTGYDWAEWIWYKRLYYLFGLIAVTKIIYFMCLRVSGIRWSYFIEMS